MATACSLLMWTILDIIFFKKPSVIGAVQGMITGLVAITPAAGERNRNDLPNSCADPVVQVSWPVGAPSSLAVFLAASLGSL